MGATKSKKNPPYQLGKKWINRKRPTPGLKRVPCSEEKKEKIRNKLKGKYGGILHYLWKGGITPERNKLRGSAEYKLWRKAVFSRDSFTCQKYGTKGGYLVAHHINNFAEYPELRFAIDNGITLSDKAHKEFHKKYGKTNNTLEQLNEFINK